MSWLLLPLQYKKSGGKTVNAASVKKTLVMSQPISSRTVSYCCPRAAFCGRTKTQTSPVPHSSTFNGSEDIKPIRQPSYLLNTTTEDFFLFSEVKLKLTDLSLSQGGLMTNIEGVGRTSSKNKSAVPFRPWMDSFE